MPSTTSLVEDYSGFEHSLGVQPPVLTEIRRAGLARFEEVGLPSHRQEEWRGTNVAPIARARFQRFDSGLSGSSRTFDAKRLAPFLIPGCTTLVFVNGRLRKSLSKLDLTADDSLSGDGVYVGSLADALVEIPDRVLPHLGHELDPQQPFVALNAAFLADGAFIDIPRGHSLTRPIHLVFASEEPAVSYPRNLILVGETASLTVLESYVGNAGDTYFTCGVTEIVGGAGSNIDHYKLQRESKSAYHVAVQHSLLSRSCNFSSHSVSIGAALARNDIQAILDGEGIECTLNGLYLPTGTQHVDNRMRVDHAKPHCNSYELYKGVLDGRSRAIFNGRIRVFEDAQKTDAKQSNRNLLLSAESIVQSNPQLEIFADDVRCTHGSTTGHLDDEAMFYLRSRGIGAQAARSLLIYAFAAEVLEEIKLESVRKDLEEFLFDRLPKGEIVRQAV